MIAPESGRPARPAASGVAPASRAGLPMICRQPRFHQTGLADREQPPRQPFSFTSMPEESLTPRSGNLGVHRRDLLLENFPLSREQPEVIVVQATAVVLLSLAAGETVPVDLALGDRLQPHAGVAERLDPVARL